jgi:hypothetical protein
MAATLESAVIVTPEELIALLDAGDFGAVIGTAETGEIDFKRDPYRVEERAQAFELAKDVAALANGRTGTSGVKSCTDPFVNFRGQVLH